MNIVYRTTTVPSVEVELPLKILVMGDHMLREDPRPLNERRPVPIDKDTFDAVLAAQDLRLDLAAGDKPFPATGGSMTAHLRFQRIKDFSPEGVANQLSETRRLLALQRALRALAGPLGGVPGFRKRLQAVLGDRTRRARLAAEVGVELPGSFGRLALPRARWGPHEVLAILEVDNDGDSSTSRARVETRIRATGETVRSFELAAGECPIQWVSLDASHGSYLVVALEVGGAPVVLVHDKEGALRCAIPGSLVAAPRLYGDMFLALIDFPLPRHPYRRLAPVCVNLRGGEPLPNAVVCATDGALGTSEGFILRVTGAPRLIVLREEGPHAAAAHATAAPRAPEAADQPDASGLPRWLRDRVDAVVPDDVRHIGCVCVDEHRRFSLVASGGVDATFPAVERRPGERPSEALTRCLQEHLGAAVATVYPLPGAWRHGAAPAVFFAAMRARSDAPPRSAPLTAEEALRRLAASRDVDARERDLQLLALTRATSLSPARRLLLMVRELHAMGLEGIRPSCGRSVSGALWRMHLTGPDARADDPHVTFARREVRLDTSYSTTEGQRVFGREDTCFESPLELAHRLLRHAPGAVHQGLARDPEYARWYADMLAVSGPDGLFVDHADYDLDHGAFYLVNVAEGTRTVPPPPLRPGQEVDVQVALTPREDGLWFGRLDAPELDRARRWSVRVAAPEGPPAAFTDLPRLTKVASWSDITDAVQRVEPQPFRTREVNAREAWFEVDHPTRWPAVLAEKTVAIYLPPPWSPGRVTVELWARCPR